MVAPVVGPLTEEWTSPDMRVYRYFLRYNQVKPYNLKLEYARRTAESSSSGGWAPDAVSVGAYNWLDYTEGDLDWDPVLDKAYGRLKEKLTGEAANWSVNLVEYNQALRSLTNRAVQLRAAWTHLRRWDLPRFFSTLKVPERIPQRVSRRKSVASNWLEFHFGWAPLVQDIYNSVDVLQNEPKPRPVRASASDSGVTTLAVEQNGGDPNSFYPGLLSYHSHNRMQYARRVAMGSSLRVVNPNLFLANQLGLTNPALLAWELVPFSFVVDWFSNVGEFLTQGTDLMGCSLEGDWTSRSFRLTNEVESRSTYRWVDNGSYVYGGTFQTRVTEGVQMRRRLGLERPGLFIRPAKLWGWQRALTAFSLLIQVFAKR